MNPDCGTTEKLVIEAGHSPLSSAVISKTMIDKTLLGDYGYLFKFAVTIDDHGRMEGKNNAGAHQFGQCVIANNTISVNWDGSWDNTTCRAYAVDGMIKLFDVETGEWRTTFTKVIDGNNLQSLNAM
jgi:hypothetical protein